MHYVYLNMYIYMFIYKESGENPAGFFKGNGNIVNQLQHLRPYDSP